MFLLGLLIAALCAAVSASGPRYHQATSTAVAGKTAVLQGQMATSSHCNQTYQHCGWYLTSNLGYVGAINSGIYFCLDDTSAVLTLDCGARNCCGAGTAAHCCYTGNSA
ncbi:hypothetical protein MAPG_06093 [Magnaporthiopsis poae ATCC 64411]|uniref:Hydrophobin n=1 Tax=Magnaporthiopsis poae (strain ATCC 64411 / 73-15) TaxID=644358 RepID=A0A0C4E145_MAGP6|nr:hypothetical protein MAPG_06093 [Magnaporthiopsis poae ATCC 64411]